MSSMNIDSFNETYFLVDDNDFYVIVPMEIAIDKLNITDYMFDNTTEAVYESDMETYDSNVTPYYSLPDEAIYDITVDGAAKKFLKLPIFLRTVESDDYDESIVRSLSICMYYESIYIEIPWS
jgi:hypothetical protein